MAEFEARITATDMSDPVCRLNNEQVPVADHRVMPHLKCMLFQVTGDAAVHFHHLRHSAASWVFLVLLSNQVPIADYIDRAPFLEDVLALRRVAEHCLLSPFHPLGSRAYVTCDLLGHGSPATMFRHYIHVLDLLLYMAVDSSRGHGDQQLQLAALGMSPTSRLTDYRPAKALQSVITAHTDRVVVHPRQEKTTPVDVAVPGQGRLDFDTLATLWADDTGCQEVHGGIRPAETGLDAPPRGAPRQAAAAALRLLQAALTHDGAAAGAAIALLAAHRMKTVTRARWVGRLCTRSPWAYAWTMMGWRGLM